MESALTISPPVSRAICRARADLPLAVGPAIRTIFVSGNLGSSPFPVSRGSRHRGQTMKTTFGAILAGVLVLAASPALAASADRTTPAKAPVQAPTETT